MKNVRILSVDDEISFAELLRQYFEPRGYEIDITSDGNKALEFLSQKRYDVLLLDFKMAGLNGDEVMRRTRQLYPDMRVIFVTAFNDAGKTKERLLSEGGYAFVEKPITSLKYLENLVNEAVAVKR